MTRPLPVLRRAALCAPVALLIAASAGASLRAGERAPREASEFDAVVAPFVAAHCLACHDAERNEASLTLSAYTDEDSVLAARRTWRTVAQYLRDGEMPPPERPRPAAEDVRRVVDWIERALATDAGPADPGRVTMRRLNRTEYDNTVRDLFGIDFRPAADFPADDFGYGFDNNGDVLSMPPLLFEKYLGAAEAISERVIVVEAPDPPARVHPGRELKSTGQSHPRGGRGRVIVVNGELHAEVRVPRDGEYVLRVLAYGDQAGPDPVSMALRIDGRTRETVELTARREAPSVHELRVRLPLGVHRFGAAFLNDYWKPDEPDPGERDRNMTVVELVVTGPVDLLDGEYPKPHRRVMVREPAPETKQDDVRHILRHTASRAFRRPATDDEVERLARLVAAVEAGGDPLEQGIRVALQAILTSPHFLFRVEKHPAPDDPRAVREVGEYALASRLSYFLWSSTPDDELLRLAGEGKLRASLSAQTRRMLRDEKARALVSGFGAQWLQLGRLDTAAPDPDRFPEFDAALRRSMRRETEALLGEVFREDGGILTLLDARHTYVDARLSGHYGMPADTAPDDDDLVRVELPDGRRGGVLGHAAVLTLTSYPTRTSPVKRGKWILEQIVGKPTPPPPPGADSLPETNREGTAASLRERMSLHREKPECRACHARMDPLGLALENFDAIGRWRERDGKFEIDASGELPDGTTFVGAEELRRALLADDAFPRSFIEKLLTYALGRGLVPADEVAVDAILERAKPSRYRFTEIVLGIVESAPFRMHRGEREP